LKKKNIKEQFIRKGYGAFERGLEKVPIWLLGCINISSYNV